MWTDLEVEILTKNYPLGGYSSCGHLLSSKSRRAINSKAMRLGLSLSDKIRFKIASEKGKENLIHDKGSGNLNWKGGPGNYDRAGYKIKSKTKYPEKDKARELTRLAIKTGLIIRKPCVVCGDIKSEAHHIDYAQPYNVVFLCRKHHCEAHKMEVQ